MNTLCMYVGNIYTHTDTPKQKKYKPHYIKIYFMNMMNMWPAKVCCTRSARFSGISRSAVCNTFIMYIKSMLLYTCLYTMIQFFFIYINICFAQTKFVKSTKRKSFSSSHFIGLVFYTHTHTHVYIQSQHTEHKRTSAHLHMH